MPRDYRRRDDERRGERSRRDAGRERYDRRSDRDKDRGDDRKNDREDRDRRRDADDRSKDKSDGRRDEKENKKEEENGHQKRKAEEVNGEKTDTAEAPPPQKKVKNGEDITTRTGGAYIHPAKLRMMQAQITDKSSIAYQRMAWEALKKSINGLINKVNVSNIVDIVRELFQENIVRGRGLLSRSMIQSQSASQTFTHVYAALVAIINTKFPQIGELILQRLILQFKRGFKRNDKNQCLSSTRFVAHLVNQQVAHEVVALEMLTLLLENATEDSVEVSISFLKECGQKLTEVSPRGINAIFERLRTILHEGQLDKRVQYMVEVMFAIRKDGFKAHPAVISDLDLVEEEDQFTHLLQLDDVSTGLEQLNIFKADDDYLENEEKYKELKKEILAENSSDEEVSGDESGSDDSSDEDEDDENEEGKQDIIDQTETNMVHLRRTIYLTIQSSLDFEECAHKLLKMELKPGQEVELCYMILDCCAQLRTYEKFFGLLAQRFCQLDKKYVEPFQTIFQEQFETIHRLDTNKLRNVAKLFAHLLHTDSISWGVMRCMKLTEEDTTSASRIFIKILFLELSEYMGLPKLNNRLRDPTMQEFFEGILPRHNPKDTRFAINFFTTIGLGGLTEDLRDHLKGLSKQLMQQKQLQEQQMLQKKADSSETDSSDSDSSESDSSESDSSDSSSGSSDSSDSEESDSSSDSDSKNKGKKRKKDQIQKASSLQKRHNMEKQQSRLRVRGDEPKQKKPDRLETRSQDRQHDRARRDVESEREVNGRHANEATSRPRIEEKLLKLSLEGIDPAIIAHSHIQTSVPPPKRSKNKKGKGRKRDRGKMSKSNNKSDRDVHGSSFEQNSDRDHYFRGDMEEMARRRGMSPQLGRPARRADSLDAMDRRAGRMDPSPPARLGGRREDLDDDYRRPYVSPPGRGVDRRVGSPLLQDRMGDYESPPNRLNMEDHLGGYNRHLDDLSRSRDRRILDSPLPRYQNEQDPDSPRAPRRRDDLSPLPQTRGARREVETSPPTSRRLDSPSRIASSRSEVERSRDMPRSREDIERGRDDRRRGLDIERSFDRSSRGDMEAVRNVERGGRGDRDKSIDRLRADDRSLDRGGRADLDRARDLEPRHRDVDRDGDRVRGDLGPSPRDARDFDRGGRGDSPRLERREVLRSPPPQSRRESSLSDAVRDSERRRGGGTAFEGDGRGRGEGRGRSLSPAVRKNRNRLDDNGPARRQSPPRDLRDDRRKGSGSRPERDSSHERSRGKRRR